MEAKKFEKNFKFICPVCGRVEVDRFLRACFGCWKNLSSGARRRLLSRPLTAEWVDAGFREA